MEVLAIIPARSGSKSVVDKNIRIIGGKPMIAHSIAHALECDLINRVIVSTDSEKYADIAREYGAEIPFIRPAEYATDTALDFDVFYHALSFLKEKENYIPDIVVQLRPTYPIRRISDIEKMVKYLADHPDVDSMRCIAPAKEVPYKMWLVDGIKGSDSLENETCVKINPLMTNIDECYNMPRQQLPKAYYQNACIDVIRTKTILEEKSMSGMNIAGYVMDENFDIDTEEEFLEAEKHINGNK